MIIPKMLINTVANKLVKHFKLDKIMSYVFEDNILDKTVKKLKNTIKKLETRIKALEVMSHPPREFVVCEQCKRKIKQGE